jgi:hypothetical protein
MSAAAFFDSTWHVTLRFVLSSLAVYRVAHLIAREDGPWDVFRRLRASAKNSAGGRLVSCVDCLSVWLSVPLAVFVGHSWFERVVAWWALSGAVVLVDRATRDPFVIESQERSS